MSGSRRRSSGASIVRDSVFVKFVVTGMSFIDTILINRYLGVAIRGEYSVLIN